MRKNTPILVVLMCLLMGISEPASGFDQDDMVMHGFASQGYLKSSDNNYLGNSKDGSYEFNEIGINFMVPVTDSLRFGIQFFSQDMGNYGNNDLTVDWALLDYNFSQYLGFRAGKVKMPYGMRNRSRDVDNIRTSVILNQAVYLEGLRDMIIALYGFNLYGSAYLGALGEIEYEISIGTFDMKSDSAFILDSVNRIFASDPILAELASSVDLSDFTATVEYVMSGMFLWHTPVSGLSFSITDLTAKMTADFPDFSTDAKGKAFLVSSVKYDYQRFSWIAEWMTVRTEFSMTGGASQDIKYLGWYTELSYQVTAWMYLAAAYGEFYPNSDDKDGSDLEKGGVVPDYYAWQKDTTFSSKFNVNEYLSLKFEVHYIDGAALTNISDYVDGETKEHWFLYAFKTSINF